MGKKTSLTEYPCPRRTHLLAKGSDPFYCPTKIAERPVAEPQLLNSTLVLPAEFVQLQLQMLHRQSPVLKFPMFAHNAHGSIPSQQGAESETPLEP